MIDDAQETTINKENVEATVGADLSNVDKALEEAVGADLSNDDRGLEPAQIEKAIDERLSHWALIVYWHDQTLLSTIILVDNRRQVDDYCCRL
ncbi:hypothetical protein HAX54_038366 [Datura stramonium]|uniref:Uncharacterized protein n=1 Tax=Datura stramonium TaxID=4076 RepID=A0ABS8VMX3_DATST|nr:hypothetical protein [Datura stramonium]